MDKIIMYDSPEAGRLVTVTVWEVDNPNGIIYTPNEHSARWNNCTHLKCECGNIREKHYTICPACRQKSANDRYNKLPYKEWDMVEPVVLRNGDQYFFSVEELEYYMDDNEMNDVELLICEPVHYSQITDENVADDSHENYTPPKELEQKIKEFNDFLKTLPPHSWRPGKVRTSYKLANKITINKNR